MRLSFLVCVLLCLLATQVGNGLMVGIDALLYQSDNNDGRGRHDRGQGGRGPLPIVFVYIVMPAVCKHGLPEYIQHTLKQALFVSSLNGSVGSVVLATNYKECPLIARSVSKITDLIRVDTSEIWSNRTAVFANMSTRVFQADHRGELWLTSAWRFLILEDLMVSRNYTEMLHVEADNTLYGDIASLLSVLRRDYPLAATPLTASKHFVTASVFWVSNVTSLLHFNDYLMSMITNEGDLYKDYLLWLRKYACCKKGGVDPDQHGNGIKPFAINEMSMLAFYHRLFPNNLKMLPVVPSFPFLVRKPFCNISNFSPEGWEAGGPTGAGIWDPNSWGQYIGGTSNKRGRNKGFVDSSHIAGQGIIIGKCIVQMLCGNQSYNQPQRDSGQYVHSYSCYTAPFVRCGQEGNETNPWTPLWNLHVHSKHTLDYRSTSCPCPAPPPI